MSKVVLLFVTIKTKFEFKTILFQNKMIIIYPPNHFSGLNSFHQKIEINITFIFKLVFFF